MSKTLRRAAAILSIFAAVAAGCGRQTPSAAADGRPETGLTVRVGFFPNITHAQALTGQETGAFADAFGAENTVAWHKFNAGPSVIEALFSGALDLAYIGPGPAINAYVKSRGDFQIIAGASGGGAVLVARQGADIDTAADLDGKKVAVPQFGNTQDLTLRGLLADNGLDDVAKGGTVTVVAAENSDILTLLQAGQLDAALVPEPWGSRLLAEADARLVLDYDELWRGDGYSTAVILASRDFVAQHPWAVRTFLKVHAAQTDAINADRSAAQAQINRRLEALTGKALPPAVLEEAFSRVVITTDPLEASVKTFAQMAYDTGFLPAKPDLSALFDLTVWNEATD